MSNQQDEDDVAFHWLDAPPIGSGTIIDGKYFYVVRLVDGGQKWDSANYNGDRHLVYGGDGDDIIHTHGSWDIVYGGDGNDIIYGGTGRDWLYGEGGDDVIYGGMDADVIYGGDGNDLIFGGNGHDTLYGGAGDDILFGGKGDDTIYGGSGNDWLFTGAIENGANDRLFGGSGADTFVLGEVEEGSVEIAGVNWLQVGINLGGGAAYVALRSVIGGSIARVGKEIVPVALDVIKGLTSHDKIKSPKASYVTVEDFNPLEDVVIIPMNRDGKTNIFLSRDTNSENALTIKSDTGSSVDIIATLTFAEAEAIFGPGFTSLHPSAQEGFLNALMQNALIIDENGVTLGMQGGTQLDMDMSLLNGFGPNQYLILGAYSGYNLQGDNGANYLFGTHFGDVLSGYNMDPGSGIAFAPELAGSDEFWGFDGDDLFFGGGGNDYIFGGEGDDTSSYIHSPAGIHADMSATLTDANGTYYQVSDGFGTTDKLYSVEHIIGSDHDDTIIGDSQDNVFVTGFGDDTMTGGGGADSFVITGGANVISDFSRDDGDTIQIDGFGYGIRSRAEIDVTWDGNVAQLSTKGKGIVAVTVDDKDKFDLYEDVQLFSSESTWVLDSADLLWGPDMIMGTDGDDYLVAEPDGSALVSGKGNDTLVGGAGYDIYVLNGGSNTILNYHWGVGGNNPEKIYIDREAYGVSDVNDIDIEFFVMEGGSTGIGAYLRVDGQEDPIATVDLLHAAIEHRSLELFN